jgi:hypothetical protein
VVIGAGAAGAAALPVWQVGVGWPAGAAVVALAAILARRSSAVRAPERWWRLAAGCAGGALVATAALRAAGWLVALCLIAAVGLGSYALVGGADWAGIWRGCTALPVAGLRGPLHALRGAGWPGEGDTARVPRWWRPALGFAAGMMLLLVFGALFRAADPRFADLLSGWTARISVAAIIRAVLGFLVVATLALGAVPLARANGDAGGGTAPAGVAPAPDAVSDERQPGDDDRPPLPPVEWIIPLAMLDALFAIFVWVQFTTLFAGNAYVLGPAGPDYADYARGGFRQLTAVTILTLAVVAVVSMRTARAGPRERAVLRVLAGVLCGLTLVVVASALRRMLLYTAAYGFTGARLAAFTGEAWLGAVFVLILASGVHLRRTWLPRAVAGAAVVALLAVVAINPEARFAGTHIGRLDRDYPLDLGYLSTLSADAVVEIDALPEPDRSCVLAGLQAELRRADPWYGWNLSRQRARALLARRPAGACPFPGSPPSPQRSPVARRDG